MENLKELLEENAELLIKQHNGFRCCIDTNSFSESKALKELALNKLELNQSNQIIEWCFDDGWFHIVLTEKTFKGFNTTFGLEITDHTWLNK